jgi:hypothetical protein
MTTFIQTTAGASSLNRQNRAVTITAVTAALALMFGLLVLAEMPGAADLAPMAVLPAVASLTAPDTSVPAARFSADQAAEELPATF